MNIQYSVVFKKKLTSNVSTIMASIFITNLIIRFLFLQAIFLIVIEADNTSYNNATINDESIRLRRSPGDDLPEILEAMIIDESGRYLHLKWEKQKKTLINEHVPLWIAHRNKWGTYHESRSDWLGRLMATVTPYYDVKLNSAVLYSEATKLLSGGIDTGIHIRGLPTNLLHKCHRVGGEYLELSKTTRHGELLRPHPKQSDIDRFEDCGNGPRSSLPSQSRHCTTADKKTVTRRDVNLEQYNLTNTRRRRDVEPTHFYIETLLLVKHDVVVANRQTFGASYLPKIIWHHVHLFNTMDMLLAKLRKHNVHFHINLAGVIIEDDEKAFDSVIEFPHDTEDNEAQREILPFKFARYLKYHDLPFGRDSVDLIYLSTFRLSILRQFVAHMGREIHPEAITWNFMDVYKTRQVYKHLTVVPLIAAFTNNRVQSACTGVHEIGHVLHVEHDRVKAKPGTRTEGCNSLMQRISDYCYHCSKWSDKSVAQIVKFTQRDTDRCFYMNYPTSLYPAGPREGISAIQQCHCYGYRSYEKTSGSHQVVANGCAQRLQCKDPINQQSLDDPTILPLDGTPCGKKKVCWRGKCVNV